MDHGRLHVLAIFDKPEPLTGPYFEETVYLTPTARTRAHALAIIPAVTRAAHAAGLWHGPVHAECRVPARARSWCSKWRRGRSAGLCARALAFDGPDGHGVPLEEVLAGAGGRPGGAALASCRRGCGRDDGADSRAQACCAPWRGRTTRAPCRS